MCLELYTALQLLRRGWRFAGEPSLGMLPIEGEQSAWKGECPVPRMVQNQLNHQLELHMGRLDARILVRLQKLLVKKDPESFATATLAMFLLLHIRELDAARIIYWKRYKDSVSCSQYLYSLTMPL